MNELFQNKDSTNCPIKKCDLKTNDCLALYKRKELVIFPKSAFDFELISSNSDLNQKSIQVCVSCSNGFQTINHDNLEIKYTGTYNIDGIPSMIFTVINFNFPVKVKDVAALRIASPL